MPRSMGFGIQSPSAYHFVRDVITEHAPCIAYDFLQSGHFTVEVERLKLLKLYLRIAKFTQAESWFVSQPLLTQSLQDYVHAGCSQAQFSLISGACDVFLVSIMDTRLIQNVLDLISPSSLLIVEGIHRSSKALREWNRLIADKRTGVSFDVYSAGIVFFDLGKYKMNYKVNL